MVAVHICILFVVSGSFRLSRNLSLSCIDLTKVVCKSSYATYESRVNCFATLFRFGMHATRALSNSCSRSTGLRTYNGLLRLGSEDSPIPSVHQFNVPYHYICFSMLVFCKRLA